jgi:hypothetical protein
VNANAFTPNSNYFFGDYIGISAVNNVVRPIWMQMTNSGSLSVYTALVNGTLLSVDNKEGENLSGLNCSPNPFKTETEVGFSLKKSASVRLTRLKQKLKLAFR